MLARYVFDTFAQRNYSTSTSILTHDCLVYVTTDTDLWTQHKMAALTAAFSPSSATSIRPSLISVMVFVDVNNKKEEVVFSRL